MGGRGTGVARYIAALVGILRETVGLRFRVFAQSAPAIVGPHLFTPLRMRMAGTQVIHGPAHALPLTCLGLPAVLTIHDLAIYDHPEWFPAGQWLSTRVLVPYAARRARLIVCPSQATREAVHRWLGVPRDRCRVIPLGVEREFSQPVEPFVRDRVRKDLGLPGRYVLQVGTVQPRKNYVTTLRALARIPESERVPLVVAGDFGWKFEPVLRAVQDLDLSRWVRFLGYIGIPDQPALYQMAAAVVFPSLDEGFGLPVLEAFAAGVPLVAARAGAIPEVAGEAALLIPPKDDVALADALMQVLADGTLRERLAAAGRTRAAEYGWPACAQAHHAVYREATAAA